MHSERSQAGLIGEVILAMARISLVEEVLHAENVDYRQQTVYNTIPDRERTEFCKLSSAGSPFCGPM